MLNSLTHLFHDHIVKYLIYVWWWFSLCWNSFELIQNFRYYVLSKYRYIYTSHYHKVLCKVMFIGSSHIDMCYYQYFTKHLNNSFNQRFCPFRKTLHVSNDSKSRDRITSSIWSFRMRFVLMWLSHLCYYNNGIIIT